MRKLVVIIAVAAVSCGQSSPGVLSEELPDLPSTDPQSFVAHVEELERPAVVNIWASWCLPCRSEAPLLEAAHRIHGNEVEFIGVDVQDTQQAAKAFLAEYSLDFTHFFDRDRAIPAAFGAFGTPVTMFFSADGELVQTHSGIIDERTLALGIDELLRIGG